MGQIWGWSGSVWSPIKDVKAWSGSAYTQIEKIHGWSGSVYGLLWTRSDPQTYTYYPTWTQAYMSDTGNGQINGNILSGVRENDIVQGYWESNQGSVPGPAGTWGYTSSVIAFPGLATQLAVRPVIKSASLRLTLAVGYGGDPKNTNVVMGRPDVVCGSTAPASRPHSHGTQAQQDTGDLFTANDQTKTIALNSAMIGILSNYLGINLHDTADSSTETGKRATRAIFEGASAPSSVRPLLTVTLDYI